MDINSGNKMRGSGRLKLLEAFQRLEFSIERLKSQTPDFENLLNDLNEENLALKEEIIRLKEQNKYLQAKNQEALEDVDYAIKVTEDILGKVGNEN